MSRLVEQIEESGRGKRAPEPGGGRGGIRQAALNWGNAVTEYLSPQKPGSFEY